MSGDTREATVTPIRVLGIDPGSRVTGVGVVEVDGQSLRHVHSECIRAGDGELGGRLAVIYSGVGDAIAQYQPQSVAIERVFLATNPHAALILGHARGCAMLAAVNQGFAVSEYSALEIKRSVVGTGRAEKEQVQHMVVSLLNLDGTPAEDAADAIAAAICYSNERAMQDSLRAIS